MTPSLSDALAWRSRRSAARPLLPEKIRARNRPGLIAIVYLVHAAAGLALAWPAVEPFAHRSLALPREDAVLFGPSAGLYLAEAFRLEHKAVAGALVGSLPTLLLTSYLGLLPLGALLYALGRGGRLSFADLAAAAARSFGRLSALFGLALAAMLIAGAIPLACASTLRDKLAAILDDPGADVLAAAVGLAGIALGAALGILHDLARAAVVHRNLPAMSATHRAVRIAKAHPLAAMFGWGWRFTAGGALVFVVALATAAIDVERMSGLLVVGMLHQACILALVALRASWLACALRLGVATE